MSFNSIISGIQPTGDLHIGNYIGIFNNLKISLMNSKLNICDVYMFVADLHAMTIPNDNLKSKGIEIIKWILASKLNCNLKLYFQSDITNITKGYWFLSTFTHIGEMNRMTQFKDKAELGNSNVGLYTYPILMAADILYSNSNYLAVGEDQKQHLEITRDIAMRVNNKFQKDIFTLPNFFPLKYFRVKSLNNIQQKMSKTYPDGCLFLKDDEINIYNKIKKAVTDNNLFPTTVEELEKREEAYNLATIYSVTSNISFEEIVARFGNYKWTQFKEELTGILIDFFKKLQTNYKEIDNEFALKRTQEDAEYMNDIVDDMVKKTYNLVF